METLLQGLRSLGPVRLALMGAVAVGLVAFFIFLATRLSSSQFELLYGDLEEVDASRIIAHLESQNIPYEVRKNGSQIFVARDKVAETRLAMADQGVPSGGSVGYEIFDKSDSLGTTNFQQNINLVRALEGELARTIRSIKTVKSARVHLVLPRREMFSRERQESRAAVILRMAGAARLDKQQVAAVQHLVAAAVPDLSPNNVAIVDDKGTLLARGFDDDRSETVKADERLGAFENHLSRAIEDLLEKTVGFGKVRAQVKAEMDFDRVTTTEEQFDPEGQVVRSTQTVEQVSNSREADGQTPVSVATNLPDQNLTPGGEGASNTASENRTEETVNYEVSKKVINQIREQGLVKRLSVAVLVDGIRELGPDGKLTYKPRSQEEMDLLATLVRSAIGFNADRGDSVDVINMRFADVAPQEEEELKLFFGLDKNDLLRMAEILVLSIVAILVILLVVRPLVSRAIEALPTAAQLAEQKLLAEQGAAPALAAPGDGPPGEEEHVEELIDIDRVEGRVRASSVKKVGEIVEKHPEEALSIVRSWLYQEG